MHGARLPTMHEHDSNGQNRPSYPAADRYSSNISCTVKRLDDVPRLTIVDHPIDFPRSFDDIAGIHISPVFISEDYWLSL